MNGLAQWLFSTTSATDRSVRANTISSARECDQGQRALDDRDGRMLRRDIALAGASASTISNSWYAASPAASHSAARPVSAIMRSGPSC